VRAISNHKFRVGETVEFKPGRMGFPAASRECTIVRLLPSVVVNEELSARIAKIDLVVLNDLLMLGR
jgi:hypothetical protein